MMRAVLVVTLLLCAVNGWAEELLFRTIPQDLPGFNSLPNRYIRSVSDLGDGTLMVTTGAGIGISDDAGKTFSIRTMQAGLPSNNVRQTTSTEDGVIYALTYGSTLQMAMSQDGGQSFRDITASLPDPVFPLGTYRQAFFSIGKRVFLLMSDLRAYYNTDSEGGPFVEINMAKDLGLDPSVNSALTACATSNGDIVIGFNQLSSGNVPLLKLARVQISGAHYSIAPITPSDDQTAQYLQRTQNSMACFTRNGSDEIVTTRLTSELAFLTLNDYQVTYTHYVEIPTDSNYGTQPIYPTPIVRAQRLFIKGYPILMRYEDPGFYSQLLNAKNPQSAQNEILDIQPATNGDWLIATQWGWFRCDSSLRKCLEVIPASHGFYNSGVMYQNSQGFLFPNSFLVTSATNSSATHPLFWATAGQGWTLDRNFQNPIPFKYPEMDNFQVQNAVARGARMAIMTVSSAVTGKVLYVENGSMHSVGLPVPSKYQIPMVTDMDVSGERVFINIEGTPYVADFGGNFTAFKTGELSGFDTMYANGKIVALSSGKDGTKLALSYDGGNSYTMVSPETLGLPEGQAVQLTSYRGYAIAAVANSLYQVFLSPLAAAKVIFQDPSTNALSIRGSSDAGIYLDAGRPWNSGSRPFVITSDRNCYKLDAANGLSGDLDTMAFIAGSANSTLYFASPDGIVQLQSELNRTADCGQAQLP